jgi:hypothetical protein
MMAKQSRVLQLMVIAGVLGVTNVALAAGIGGGFSGGGESVAGLASIKSWLMSHVQLALVIAGIAAGLMLAFNRNFLELAQQAVYLIVIGGLILYFGGSAFASFGGVGALVP